MFGSSDGSLHALGVAISPRAPSQSDCSAKTLKSLDEVAADELRSPAAAVWFPKLQLQTIRKKVISTSRCTLSLHGNIVAVKVAPGSRASRHRGRRLAARPQNPVVVGGVRHHPDAPHRDDVQKLLAFLGPGYLVAVGYMDPGNWATSLAGGSGYALLTIALLSNLMAILLQALCARLGVGAGRDLAQACRDAFPAGGVMAAMRCWREITEICATDLAG